MIAAANRLVLHLSRVRTGDDEPGPAARREALREVVQGFAASVQSQVPLGRFGRPEEIAKAVVFLASSDSSFVVGTELVADGGMSQL